MLRGVAEKIVEEYPCEWGENARLKEACICSVENVCALMINLVILMVISVLLSKEISCLVFFVTNGIIRMFSGGIHAPTHVKCISCYVGILLASIYMADLLEGEKAALYVMSAVVPILSIRINFKYGGMQTRLEAEENRKFSRYCKIMTLFFNGILVCAGLIEMLSGREMEKGVRNALFVIAFALITQSLSLFLARKNCYNNRDEVKKL